MPRAHFFYKIDSDVHHRRLLWIETHIETGTGSKETLMLDTGADFTLASSALAEDLGINLEEEENPELKRQWETYGTNVPMQFLEKHWQRAQDKSIPTTYSGADDDSESNGHFYPVEMKLDGVGPYLIPVLFAEEEVSMPVLGRIGVFDRATAVHIDLETNEGHIDIPE